MAYMFGVAPKRQNKNASTKEEETTDTMMPDNKVKCFATLVPKLLWQIPTWGEKGAFARHDLSLLRSILLLLLLQLFPEMIEVCWLVVDPSHLFVCLLH
jgi:hypothetical protein